MKKNLLLELLHRNFSDDDYIYFGVNKKFYNQKNNKFGRDFVEKSIKLNQLAKNFIAYKDKYDLYLSFMPVKGKRLLENAQESFLIPMDIDGVDIPEDFPPSYFWETSPNKYQGVWIMDNKLNANELSIIAKKLIAKYGFDKTSSDAVHYFRIPNSFNFKYGSPFKVSALQGKGTVYRKSEFFKAFKDVKVDDTVSVTNEAIPNVEVDLEEILLKYGIKQSFNKIIGVDRSGWAWNIEKNMFEQGATKEEVKFILLNAPDEMEKFDERNVDKEVNRSHAKCQNGDKQAPLKLKQTDKKMSSLNSLKKGSKSLKDDIEILSLSQIKQPDMEDFWLVEDLWVNGSVGVVSAPPKSFKSLLTINLACAVAQGKPFQGKKTKQGNVLILQGENSLNMEKLKIFSITGIDDDSLPIYFVKNNLTMDRIGKLKKSLIALDIKLLIIDPMYILFGSGDINKNTDVNPRLAMLSELSKELGISIMLVHHSRKIERGGNITTSDMYGSTFIEGWYQSLLLLQRKGRNMSVLKTFFRDAPSGDSYNLVVDDNSNCKLFSNGDDEDDIKQSPLSSMTKKGSKK